MVFLGELLIHPHPAHQRSHALQRVGQAAQRRKLGFGHFTGQVVQHLIQLGQCRGIEQRQQWLFSQTGGCGLPTGHHPQTRSQPGQTHRSRPQQPRCLQPSQQQTHATQCQCPGCPHTGGWCGPSEPIAPPHSQPLAERLAQTVAGLYLGHALAQRGMRLWRRRSLQRLAHGAAVDRAAAAGKTLAGLRLGFW